MKRAGLSVLRAAQAQFVLVKHEKKKYWGAEEEKMDLHKFCSGLGRVGGAGFKVFILKTA